MAWLYLVVAGLFEIGWPLGLKKGWTPDGVQVWWLLFAIVSMAVSGALLMLAQRAIPMGTAYAVWMGASVVGALLVDVAFFKEPWNVFRAACALLILVGTCGLRFAATR